MNDNQREIDAWGRVLVNPEAACDLASRGIDIWSLSLTHLTDDVEAYNDMCRSFGKNEFLLERAEELTSTPQEEHARLSSSWTVPDEVKTIEVRSFILSMCETSSEIERINEEMDLFETKNLIPLLQAMIYLVDHLRRSGVVWGVGRGSSVSSYVLFKIGVHKIDSLKYDLPIREFLK